MMGGYVTEITLSLYIDLLKINIEYNRKKRLSFYYKHCLFFVLH